MNENDLFSILPLIYLRGEKKISSTNETTFPLINDKDMSEMACESRLNPEYIIAYPFVRNDESVATYIDIYFFMKCKDGAFKYNRYIIEPNRRMEEQKEKAFICMCRKTELLSYKLDLYAFVNEIQQEFEELHYPYFEANRVGEALETLYFSITRNILEILYKASLNNIARHLPYIEGVNYLGTSPSSIIAGLPLRLLRILNAPDLIEDLFTTKNQEGALALYRKFSGYFMKNCIPNPGQWRYLVLINEEGQAFNRKAFESLKMAPDPSYAKDYVMFFRLKDCWKEYYPLDDTPCVTRITTIRRNLEEISAMSHDMEYIEERLRDMARNCNYDFADEKYVVVVPEKLIELTREAAYQRNCLLRYIREIVEGDTLIVFIRSQEQSTKPLITMEIKKCEIVQAHGRANRDLSIEELDFVDRFALSKKLRFEPNNVLIELPENSSEEFDAFYKVHEERRSLGSRIKEDKISYEQLTLSNWVDGSFICEAN